MSLLKMWLNEHIYYIANILWNNVIHNQMRKTSSVPFLALVQFFTESFIKKKQKHNIYRGKGTKTQLIQN